SGIGAKIALAVLSGVSVDEFARLVQAGDVTALTRIPGIGKKTAERMVVELRDRAADLAGGGAVAGMTAAPGDPMADAATALQQLGYKPADAQRMARDAAAPGDEAAAIIRKALQSALRGARARAPLTPPRAKVRPPCPQRHRRTLPPATGMPPMVPEARTWPWCWAPSASCSATSAPARCTRSRKRSRRTTARPATPTPCWARCRGPPGRWCGRSARR